MLQVMRGNLHVDAYLLSLADFYISWLCLFHHVSVYSYFRWVDWVMAECFVFIGRGKKEKKVRNLAALSKSWVFCLLGRKKKDRKKVRNLASLSKGWVFCLLGRKKRERKKVRKLAALRKGWVFCFMGMKKKEKKMGRVETKKHCWKTTRANLVSLLYLAQSCKMICLQVCHEMVNFAPHSGSCRFSGEGTHLIVYWRLGSILFVLFAWEYNFHNFMQFLWDGAGDCS